MTGGTERKRVQGLPVQSVRAEVVGGPDRGKIATTPERVSAGTAEGNDLVLTDPSVSRHHVELRRVADRIEVRDLGSTNGTRSGSIFIERAHVPAGTTLELGDTTILVEDGGTVDLEVLGEDALGRIRGRSPVMRALMAKIQRAAKSDASILIVGETGTGKELIARAIHEESDRSRGPFETVDCGALLPTLVASELFGHEQGAFTGADRSHRGAFERADGGTIFLDEIGEIPPAVQAALLGALERRRFRRVGGSEEIAVDVRVVAATNRDLRAEVNRGTFRSDLYYRIAVVLLAVPALRDRASDIPLLVEHFLRLAGSSQPVAAILSAAAMKSLETHHWPGNVRELENLVEAALVMGEVPALPAAPSAMTDLEGKTYKEARRAVLDRFEAGYLGALLERAGGNISRAARESGLNRNYLTQMLERHRLK
jgi:DNA-binding NtrC family response regulator